MRLHNLGFHLFFRCMNIPSSISMLLADDHALFREALVAYLERASPQAQISSVKDLHEANEKLSSGEKFDIAMIDWRMPGITGIDDLKKLVDAYPRTRFALMSGVVEDHDVHQALHAGLWGYFPKTLSGKTLVQGVQQILKGQKFIPTLKDSHKLQPSYQSDGYFYLTGSEGSDPSSIVTVGRGKLSVREIDVVVHLCRGATNAEISELLGIKLVTVKLHVRNICQKLGARNRTEAAIKARQLGIIHGGR
jgi:two-component system, NarL family, nitrate/nitrite response regulator NarL